jgi:peptide/nickel transport system ATP-binding protein
MTIGRQLAEVAGSLGEAERLLNSVRLPDAKERLKSYPHELSGGQRQRVMIAMAIAGDPQLVVADEPTTALDVTIQAQILQLIRRLRDELGCAFLVVTHDLGVAAQIADRIAVCYGGLVVEAGPANDVLKYPTHPYTAGLLRSRITLASKRLQTLETLPGEPPDMRKPPAGCPFTTRCAYVIDECSEVIPPLLEVRGRAQRSACIRISEISNHLIAPPVEKQSTGAVPASISGPGNDAVALRLRNLHKTYKLRGAGRKATIAALRGIDLDVGANECIALVGESGCGKSSLLRVIAGLTKPDGGAVEMASEGRPQMVFQDAAASLTPWISVGELITERLRAVDVPRRQIETRMHSALTRVGLSPEVAEYLPRQLSGGQQQRVAIARAIAVPPPLLLCDEPTSSLDVSLAATILNLISDLRRSLGMAVIFVTHDLAVARFVADRIAVMYLGRIVEIGPAEDLTREPAHPYTRALLSAVPDLGDQPPRAKGELPSPLRVPSGCPYHPRCISAIPACEVEDQPLRNVEEAGHHRAACIHVEEKAR